jgi:glycosyltransferase involved in cell wall biosynthesis
VFAKWREKHGTDATPFIDHGNRCVCLVSESHVQTPLISVVMPVWNGEKYLRPAIESILAQTFQRFELIVLDDGSTDSTPAILAAYAHDSRLRVIRLKHGGIVLALNRGIAEAESGWIARMDSDDIAHPKRLERQWKAISRNPDAVFCHSNVKLIGDPAFLPRKTPRFPRTQSMLRLRMCFHCPIAHSSTLLRKDTVIAAGGYRLEERHAEDYALWGRMLSLGRFVGVSEPLLDLRVHGGSISKNAAETQLSLGVQIRSAITRVLFKADAARAEAHLRAIIGERPGLALADATGILGLMARHGLLNFETFSWVALKFCTRSSVKAS